MLSYTDTNSAREVKGTVARRGLCGDVYLARRRPPAARIADVKVETSVRNGRDHVRRRPGGPRRRTRATRSASRSRDGRPGRARNSPSKPFRAGDLAGRPLRRSRRSGSPRNSGTCTRRGTCSPPQPLAARRRGQGRWTPPAGALRVPRVLDRGPRLLPQRHAHLPLRRPARQRPGRRRDGDLRGRPREPGAAQELRHQLRLHPQLRLRAGLAPELRGDPARRRRRGHARRLLPAALQPLRLEGAGRRPRQRLRAPRRVLRPRRRRTTRRSSPTP